jgi:cell wall-associated NlpC family hydrolase
MPSVSQSPQAGLRQKLVEAARQAAKDTVGKPYTENGRSTAGFDCSGFVTYVYKKVFPDYVHLNTDAIDSSSLYQKLVASPQPGDLIYFPKGINPYDKKSHPNHVGIILDSNAWIGSQTSTGVAKVMLTNPWWSPHAKFFLRYLLLR